MTESLMFFASPLPPILSLRSLRCGGDLRTSLAPIKPGTAGYSRRVTRRTSQVPGQSIPYLCPALRSRPAHRPSPLRSDDAVPRQDMLKTPAQEECRDSITRLRYPLPTLQVMRYRTRMQGSLPVGG